MSHQPDNISAGTQVVSLVEVRGPNNSLVHPRGAVGVVTRTPAAAGENYLVRFPDGFEKALSPAQLEVLKHFKDRLDERPAAVDEVHGVHGVQAPPAPPAFDLESVIIYRCVIGSCAYGLDHDESDTDRRGIYLAPAELQWSLFGAPEQFEDNASQSCYWELQKFIIMALRANPNILECLYSPIVEKTTELGAELLAHRQVFLSQMIFQTFNGYALSQFKKMEQDLRNHGDVGRVGTWGKPVFRFAVRNGRLEVWRGGGGLDATGEQTSGVESSRRRESQGSLIATVLARKQTKYRTEELPTRPRTPGIKSYEKEARESQEDLRS